MHLEAIEIDEMLATLARVTLPCRYTVYATSPPMFNAVGSHRAHP